MNDGNELILVLTTEADSERAESLAAKLFELQLVACVSFLFTHSLYPWNGKIQHEAEVQMLMKTKSECLKSLEKAITELHSYEIPEFICWPAEASRSYADWVSQACISSD